MAHSPNVIGKLYSSLASDYSESSTYELGSLVFYNGEMFKCTTAITTPESWTAAHWTSTKVVDNFHKELTLEEVWQPAKVYHLDDIVQYNGKVYKCIVDNSTPGNFINELQGILHDYGTISSKDVDGSGAAYVFGCADGANYVDSTNDTLYIDISFTVDGGTNTVSYKGILTNVSDSYFVYANNTNGKTTIIQYSSKVEIYSLTDFVFMSQDMSGASIITSTDTCSLKIYENAVEPEWIEYFYRSRKEAETFTQSQEVQPGTLVEHEGELYFVGSEGTDTWHSTENGWQKPQVNQDLSVVPIVFDKTNAFQISGMEGYTFAPGDKTVPSGEGIASAWGATTMDMNFYGELSGGKVYQRNETLIGFSTYKFKIITSTGKSISILGVKFKVDLACFVILKDTPQEDANHDITVISNQPCLMVFPCYSKADNYWYTSFDLYDKFTITKLNIQSEGAINVNSMTADKMYVNSIDGYRGGSIWLQDLGYIKDPLGGTAGQVLGRKSVWGGTKLDYINVNHPSYQTYDETKTYSLGDRVYNNFKYYMAKKNVPINTTPPDSTYWVEVVPENEAASQLTALATALGATFSITWDSTNNKFVYTYSI